MYITRDEASLAFCFSHFMAFRIYAWYWLGMENCVYPTCFALESLSSLIDHSLSSHTSSTSSM